MNYKSINSKDNFLQVLDLQHPWQMEHISLHLPGEFEGEIGYFGSNQATHFAPYCTTLINSWESLHSERTGCTTRPVPWGRPRCCDRVEYPIYTEILLREAFLRICLFTVQLLLPARLNQLTDINRPLSKSH